MFTEPDRSTVLGALVSRVLMSSSLLTNVPNPKLLITTCCSQHGSIGIPSQALYDIGVFDGVDAGSRVDVPKSGGKISRGGGENILDGGVEKNLSYFSRMTGQLRKRRDIGGLFGISDQGEPLGDLP